MQITTINNPNKVLGYRKMYKLNQSVLAKELNIGLNTYSFKENGKTEFTLSEMRKLTLFFKQYNPDLTMDEIFL